MLWLVRFLATALFVAGLAAAGPAEADFASGLKAYLAGDYAAAIAAWRSLAEEGDARAQFGLGLVYGKGRGLPQDFAQARHWYREAAGQGHAGAQFNLGNMYRLGSGVDRDPAQAVKLWRLAAEQGLPQAQVGLGVAYERGEGVRKDDAQAVAWYRKAADQGDPDGQFYLGYAYESGKGVAADLEEAAKWYRMAAAVGDSRAADRLQRLAVSAKGGDEEGPAPEASPATMPLPLVGSTTPGAEPIPEEAEGEAAGPREAVAADEVALALPTRAPSPGVGFVVQLGAFGSRGAAENALRAARESHADLLSTLPYRLEKADLGLERGPVFRVQVGPLPSREEAAALCRRLAGRGASCFVARP